MRTGFVAITIGLALINGGLNDVRAQEARLAGRPFDAVRTQIESILASARSAGLPAEPLVDKALQGAASNAPPDLIVVAVTRLRDELRLARDAFGNSASEAELKAGASALRAGATSEDLSRLRTLRQAQKGTMTMAAALMADLIAAGVPADTGIAAVLALASNARDADYVAFRRNVERDIALGASPAAAIGVRLQAAAEALDAPGFNTTGGTTSPLRKRKP